MPKYISISRWKVADVRHWRNSRSERISQAKAHESQRKKKKKLKTRTCNTEQSHELVIQECIPYADPCTVSLRITVRRKNVFLKRTYYPHRSSLSFHMAKRWLTSRLYKTIYICIHMGVYVCMYGWGIHIGRGWLRCDANLSGNITEEVVNGVESVESWGRCGKASPAKTPLFAFHRLISCWGNLFAIAR